MKKTRWIRGMLTIGFIGMLLIGMGKRLNTFAAEERVVRVGLYEMEGFQSFDELSNAVGYNIEYLNRVAAITGWTFEYVRLKDFNDGMVKLKDRKVDILAPAEITPERMKDYDYSAYSFGTEYAVLVTRAGNESYSYEDYQSFQGMRVAVIKDYLMTEHFKEYMEQNGFEAQLIYYESPEEVLDAVSDGKADAAVTNLMMASSANKVLARFSPSPFYYITWKGNDQLLEELDGAMRSIKNTYPALENTLTEDWFPMYQEQYFSGEEEAYAASLGTLKVGYIPGNLPVSYQNEENGELGGISRVIFDRIQEISGLEFEYEALPYGPVTYEYLRDNGFDLVTGVEYNSTNINTPGLFISNPYLTSKRVIVAGDDIDFRKEDNLKMAISTGSQTIKKVIAAAYPNFELVDYETVGDCFEAVKNGRADLLMQNQYVVEYWLARPQYEGLSIIPVEGLDDGLCFSSVVYQKSPGVKGDVDSVALITIINKSISQITKDELESITVREAMKEKYVYQFSDFFYKYRYEVILAVILAAILIIGTIYVMNLKQKAWKIHKEEENALVLQQKRYQLLVDKSEEMIYEVSLRGGSWLVSDKMKQKLGWSFPSFVENPSVETLVELWRVHPDDRQKIRESLIRMIDENGSSDSLIRMQKTDGTYIWCKVSRYPLLDSDNTLVSIVGKILDVDSEVKERRELELQSRMDGLTALMNKKTFMEEAGQYLSKHSSASTGLIFIDLDYFKEVNDTLGHITGDQAIMDAAKKLREIFCDIGLAARFGGDEFCIFVKNISKEVFQNKLTCAVKILKGTYTDETGSVSVTASIGAVYALSGSLNIQSLLDEADRALYEAKEKGRNQFVLREKE